MGRSRYMDHVESFFSLSLSCPRWTVWYDRANNSCPHDFILNTIAHADILYPTWWTCHVSKLATWWYHRPISFPAPKPSHPTVPSERCPTVSTYCTTPRKMDAVNGWRRLGRGTESTSLLWKPPATSRPHGAGREASTRVRLEAGAGVSPSATASVAVVGCGPGADRPLPLCRVAVSATEPTSRFAI